MALPSKENNARFKGRAASDKQGLTQRQYLFCEYYLKYGVGAKAYVKAGYSPNNKYSGASELLTNPKVKQYLASARKATHKNFLISKERALKELSKIAKGLKKEEMPMLMKTITVDESGREVGAKVEPVIVKKKVDGKVQLQALKEVFNMYDKDDFDYSDTDSTDDKIIKALKTRVVGTTQLQSYNQREIKFEEDDEDEEE
jgi:phage terminase small subunit